MVNAVMKDYTESQIKFLKAIGEGTLTVRYNRSGSASYMVGEQEIFGRGLSSTFNALVYRGVLQHTLSNYDKYVISKCALATLAEQLGRPTCEVCGRRVRLRKGLATRHKNKFSLDCEGPSAQGVSQA